MSNNSEKCFNCHFDKARTYYIMLKQKGRVQVKRPLYIVKKLSLLQGSSLFVVNQLQNHHDTSIP